MKPGPQVQIAHHQRLHRALDGVETADEFARSVGERADETPPVTGAEQSNDERLAAGVGDAMSVGDDETGDARGGEALGQHVDRGDTRGDEHRAASEVQGLAIAAGELGRDLGREGGAGRDSAEVHSKRVLLRVVHAEEQHRAGR